MGQRVITNNTLFYGDNLPIMREYLADETVDLIYLDPPFNSSRSYNVLYKDESGAEAEAQIVAFEDTWHWSRSTEDQYYELRTIGNPLAQLLEALVVVVGRNQMMAYLVMMAVRLVELHRVLKPTGSLYLHCDPTASHYLKLVLDMLFGARNFRNEVIWDYTFRLMDLPKFFNRKHDIILFYSKSKNNTFKMPKTEWTKDTLMASRKQKIHIDENGVEWIWMPGGKGNSKNKLRKVDELIEQGKAVSDVWQIPIISSSSKERLGYPTQKPLALLERIIQASSNPGDMVLDPFCGCGTAVHAAQKFGRIWAGIDVTPLATTLIKSRLYDAFGIEAKKDYDLIGEPTTLSDAKHLATQDRYQFQWWALGLLPARPYGGQADSKRGKKGADKGIDGIMTFTDTKDGTDKRIIVQVKSGKVKSGDIRDLNGTIEREKNAVMGVFITLEEPSKNMEIEVMEIGYYHSDSFNNDYPKIQILTIEHLLAGEKIKFPGKETTLKQAQREQLPDGEQEQLW